MLRISLDTTVYYIAHLNPNTNSRRVVKKAIEANFGPPVIRECMHFFTLPEDPVMTRKIKAQRITERCYSYLSPPLCHSVSSVSSVVFRNLILKISKSLPSFWSP